MGISDDIRRKSTHHFSGSHGNVHPPVFERQDTIPVEIGHKKDNEEESTFTAKNHFDSFFPEAKAEPETKKPVPKTTENQGSWIKKLFNRWFFFFLIVLVVSFLAFKYFDNIKKVFGLEETASETKKTETPSVQIVPQDYTTGSTQTQAEQAPAATTTPPAATSSTTADKSSLTIKVLNGNGISGSAATLKSVLTAGGYTVAFTGNANRFTYTSTYIYYKTGKLVSAQAIQTLMSSYTTVLANDDTVCGSYDIVIVAGKK